MNEVEKMYKLANIKAKEYCDRDSDACMNCCPEWKNRQDCWKYKSIMPPFTAEKQIQLILFILNTFKQGFNCRVEGGKISLDTLARGIAQEVVNCWQNLTEEEKQQIKEILE